MNALQGRFGERGATAVLVAILLAVLAGFLALVINVGHGYLIRNQLQNAADSAALAGARELNGTDAGVTAATDVAVDFAGRHKTDAQHKPENAVKVVPTLGDVEFGYWKPGQPRDSAFEVITGRTPTDLRWINAIRVKASRVSRPDGNTPMPVAMGPLLGKQVQDVGAEAIAVLGGPCKSNCPLPIAFASCLLLNEDGSIKCDQRFVFNSDTVDNIGFTNLSPDPSVNTELLREILTGGATACRRVKVGDPVGVANGAQIAPLADLFDSLAGLEKSAPVVELPGGCPAKFNEHGLAAKVIGFVKLKIIAAYGGQDKRLELQIQCDELTDDVEGHGCFFWGATPQQARLAK